MGRQRGRRRGSAPDTDGDAALGAQLARLGLYAADTTGDGNCLFRALADQLYGDDRAHAALRHATCEQLAAHPDAYAGFVENERPFEHYVRAMREDGTYGGHLELTAFAHAFNKHVKIVQPGLVYVVAGDGRRRAPLGGAPEARGPLYIAYHAWEHYSSLRRRDAPPSGHPNVDGESDEPTDEEALIMRSVPGTTHATARRVLGEVGDWVEAVERLIEGEGEGEGEEEAPARAPPPPPSPRPRRSRRLQRQARRAETHGVRELSI